MNERERGSGIRKMRGEGVAEQGTRNAGGSFPNVARCKKGGGDRVRHEKHGCIVCNVNRERGLPK